MDTNELREAIQMFNGDEVEDFLMQAVKDVIMLKAVMEKVAFELAKDAKTADLAQTLFNTSALVDVTYLMGE